MNYSDLSTHGGKQNKNIKREHSLLPSVVQQPCLCILENHVQFDLRLASTDLRLDRCPWTWPEITSWRMRTFLARKIKMAGKVVTFLCFVEVFIAMLYLLPKFLLDWYCCVIQAIPHNKISRNYDESVALSTSFVEQRLVNSTGG